MGFAAVASSIIAGININNLLQGNKQRKIEALTALQKAVIKTREYIDNIGYEPNTELSSLWLDAFEKVQNANLLNDYYRIEELYHKAKFWSNPRRWRREKGAMELVPKLKDLQEHCDSLLEQVRTK